MIKYHVLWFQRAYANSNKVAQFSNFIYEFVGARFTYLAFIALFNFASIGYSFFDKVLTSGITIVLYYLVSDAFNVFWTGVNLEYLITKEGIVYKWGIFRKHELLVPYENILKISAVRESKNKRSALIFENSEKIKNRHYGFSKELHFNVLSFENIENLDEAIDTLIKEGQYDINVKDIYSANTIDEKLNRSSLYLKFLQLLCIVFLYITTTISLNLIDTNILPSTAVKDIIISQEKRPYKPYYIYNHIKTKKGYHIILGGRYFHDQMNEDIEFEVTPIFKKIKSINPNEDNSYESFKNGYTGGINLAFKFWALIYCFFSGVYIFYKRFYIPLEDIPILIGFPAIIIMIAFLLFH